MTEDPFRGYRRWFYAAAAYNVVWGIVVCLAPVAVCRFLGIAPFRDVALLQCIGMMVGVYGYGYYLLARDPVRYSGLIWVGLAGKTFGPVGFVLAAYQGQLPWAFGWTLVLNDLIWWPAFWGFALRYARRPL